MLHLTKIAFGATGLDDLVQRVQSRAEGGRLFITTRYEPKRESEMAGGSLYWIIRHQLVARQDILGFDEESEPGRCRIWLNATLIPVAPIPRRAHQGWRYLNGSDAPRDLGDGMGDADLPPDLAGELSGLGLI